MKAENERTYPRVSIGMPVYNGERYLRGALESLLGQTMSDFELIISDNASTDQTSSICEEAVSSDRRVRYIRQPFPLSIQANFNFVLAEAAAPLFMWAAYDDRWHREFLQRLVGALRSRPTAVLAFGEWENLREDGSTCSNFRAVDWARVFVGERAKQLAEFALIDGGTTQKGNHVYGVIRTDVLREVGGIPPAPVSRGGGEDVHLLLRLLCRGEFAVVSGVLFYYRIKTLPRRPRQRVARYVWQRMFGLTPGHGGNLVLAVRGKHHDHRIRRKIIWGEAPLSLLWRTAIWIRLWIAEAKMLALVMPRDAFGQLTARPSDVGTTGHPQNE